MMEIGLFGEEACNLERAKHRDLFAVGIASFVGEMSRSCGNGRLHKHILVEGFAI